VRALLALAPHRPVSQCPASSRASRQSRSDWLETRPPLARNNPGSFVAWRHLSPPNALQGADGAGRIACMQRFALKAQLNRSLLDGGCAPMWWLTVAGPIGPTDSCSGRRGRRHNSCGFDCEQPLPRCAGAAISGSEQAPCWPAPLQPPRLVAARKSRAISELGFPRSSHCSGPVGNVVENASSRLLQTCAPREACSR